MGSLRINPNVADVVCSRTLRSLGPNPFTQPVGLCDCCPKPGSPVLVRYDLVKLRSALDRDAGVSDRAGLWEHAQFLPVLGVDDGYAADVGITPTQRHAALGDEYGVELWVKNEAINPTGTFKDRGLAVAVALAKACGARRLCLPTQGNAGVAASLFCSRLGLEPCIVYMPEGYEQSVYHRGAAHFGAEVEFGGANIASAGQAMREKYAAAIARGDLVDVSTFFEPGRLEGKKTLGLEIFADFGAERLPDGILYPTGGGTGLVGIWKALQELVALDRLEIGRHALPKLIAVQSEQCAPVVRAFEKGLDQVEPVESRGTIADGLDVPAAIMGHGILAALRESGGDAIAVSETAIASAFERFGRAGINGGYEAAATLAALERLRREERVAAGARILLLNTGTHSIPLSKLASRFARGSRGAPSREPASPRQRSFEP